MKHRICERLLQMSPDLTAGIIDHKEKEAALLRVTFRRLFQSPKILTKRDTVLLPLSKNMRIDSQNRHSFCYEAAFER